jgi:HD-GYP domain-containing protein (c-di-GMP phosphodiesterase class II)
MPEIAVAKRKPAPKQLAPTTAERKPATLRERRRREEALRRHRADARASGMASAGEVAYLRAQLQLGARLTGRLAATNDVEEMTQLVVDELHETFAFYLAAIQRLDEDETLRLIAGSGALAEVMTEFLLLEQSVHHGVNGRVARSGTSALVHDTREDPDYIERDPKTDPRAELSVPLLVDGAVWGVLNIESPERGGLSEADAVLVEAIAASLGSSIHRAMLVADLEQTFTTTLTALMSTVEAKDDYTASHEQQVADLTERVALRLGLSPARAGDVRYAALLHDVGKVAVPSEILLKPGPLNEHEWVKMRGHAATRPRGGRRLARREHPGLRPPRAGRAREPRALGRPRLPRRPARRAGPAGGAHHRRVRHLRCDRHRPPLPSGAHAGRGGGRAAPRGRLPARRARRAGAARRARPALSVHASAL